MYEIFKNLMNEKNVTPYRVAKETGIASATLSDWKNGKSTPKADKLKKIADYFGVTLDYLLGNEPKKEPTTQKNGELIDPEREQQLSEINAMLDKLNKEELIETYRYMQYRLSLQKNDEDK